MKHAINMLKEAIKKEQFNIDYYRTNLEAAIQKEAELEAELKDLEDMLSEEVAPPAEG